MKVTPGPWLMASVYMEFTMHMSSAALAVWGRSSLIHCPLWPCWENLKANLRGEGLPGFRTFRSGVGPCAESGNSLPVLVQAGGLWSNRSIWERAPDWKR